jgi:hypothetical protein
MAPVFGLLYLLLVFKANYPVLIPDKRLVHTSQAHQTHNDSRVQELKGHDLDEGPLCGLNLGVLHLETLWVSQVLKLEAGT